MDEILALPAGPLARAALDLAQQTESSLVADHSIRSFLFARLLASRDGSVGDAAYDENLLFAACTMHDLGLGTSARGKERFEVEGADLAADLLRHYGVATADVDRVWEAIALHSSIGIADRRGLLTSLTHKGVFTDACRSPTCRRVSGSRSSPPTRSQPGTHLSGTRSSRTPGRRPQPRRTRSRPNSCARNPRAESALALS